MAREREILDPLRATLFGIELGDQAMEFHVPEIVEMTGITQLLQTDGLGLQEIRRHVALRIHKFQLGR